MKKAAPWITAAAITAAFLCACAWMDAYDQVQAHRYWL